MRNVFTMTLSPPYSDQILESGKELAPRSAMSNRQHNPIQNSPSQGLLRTKVETGKARFQGR